VASTVPFAKDEGSFTELGTNARGIISRGIAVKPVSTGDATPERAEALASYVVMEGR